MSIDLISFRGQLALALSLPEGDRCTVMLHGAHVVSWVAAAVERLYLSPDAVFDGQAAIRGGVPISWPQFSGRGALPKHGFARNQPWRVDDANTRPGEGLVTLVLADDAASRALWPHLFALQMTVQLSPGVLHMALSVQNPGAAPLSFATALHTYLKVGDIDDARLIGLKDAQRFDSLRNDTHAESADALHFTDEFDSVYTAPAAPLQLVQPGADLLISQSASCTETVVWNPGPTLSAKLADLPDDGYRHMLCVEAGRVDENIRLAPGARWHGWQQLALA